MRSASILVKVVVVVAVLAVVAGGVVGGLILTAGPKDDPGRLKLAAQTLLDDLKFAQDDAVANKKGARLVVFHTEGYHVASRADATTALTGGDGRTHAVTFGTGAASSLRGVSIQSLSVGDDDVLGYGIHGQLDQRKAAEIKLAAGSHAITITINAISGEATATEPFLATQEPMPTVRGEGTSDAPGSRG